MRVRGRVSRQWLGQSLSIQDGAQGLSIPTAQATPVRAGDMVDVVGFPTMGSYTPTLENAIFRRESAGSLIVPTAITAEAAFTGNYDAQLVRIRGRLLSQDVASKDWTLVLSSGPALFDAILPKGEGGQRLSRLRDGSMLELTGVCAIEVNENRQPRAVRILLRSPGDVAVLWSPS